ncbi:hypothetical protein MAR_006213 [Mya arenaria]|uniref:Chitin-binding type-4 domain-containing protein n=1 Tax=Mya arenaria TaxID=6604 RepID=A0ABY7D7U2_MYAAR|nr:hypothetical protein MAR_006213 [Mya arenaria]
MSSLQRLFENEGRCGVCGDSWDSELPRPNEAGGLYARGIISRKYSTDQRFIYSVIQVTSSIGGYFEFYICPNDDVTKRVSRACLDEHPMQLEIPRDLECNQCVLQWRWHGASNYGVCKNGRWAKGCGIQPEIYNCADIAILPEVTQKKTTMSVSRTRPQTTTDQPSTTKQPIPVTSVQTWVQTNQNQK